MENLTLEPTQLLNSALDSTARWTLRHLRVAMDGLASLHAIHLGRCPDALPSGWQQRLNDRSAAFFFGARNEHVAVWHSVFAEGLRKQQGILGAERVEALLAILRRRLDVHTLGELDAPAVVTLIHGDIRFKPSAVERTLCVSHISRQQPELLFQSRFER